MESLNISQLYNFIISYKEDLIRGRKKLSLDPVSINNISQLDDCNADTKEIINKEKIDLKSFIELLNKIPSLKISQRSIDSYPGVIDIRCFKKLQFLVLSKVSVNRIPSINLFKSQLEGLVCIRCCNNLDLFDDENIWNELKVLNFCFGKISDLEPDIFKNAPWIQHLNLSYNSLKNVDGLQTLHHLKYLDLSFNHLMSVPSLSRNSSKNLQILLISNNYLMSLSGVRFFVNLRGLDVSHNCILDRFSIKDLFALSLLQWANLSSNPLSCNAFHRLYTVYNIGTQIAPSQFVLDNVSLNPVEQSFLGMYNKSKFNKTKIEQPTSKSPYKAIDSTTPRTIRKTSKIREVVIEEVANENEGAVMARVNVQVKPETGEHVETKKKVENLRKIYGKDWLHSQYGGSYIQDLMGLKMNEPTSENKTSSIDILTAKATISSQEPQIVSSTPQNISPAKYSLLIPPITEEKRESPEEKYEISTTIATVHAVEETQPLPPTDDSVLSTENSKNNSRIEGEPNFYSIEETESNSDDKISNSASEDQYTSATEELKVSEETDDKIFENEDISDCFILGEETLWIVQRKDTAGQKTEDIFLILLENELRERSTSSGRTITKWSLSSVQSCVKIKSDPITIEIEFDTLLKDKQSRMYIMEFADAQVLLKKLTGILESRPLSAMNQATYRCMKCSSLFSHSTTSPNTLLSKNIVITCPVCTSNMVIEMEEPRLPSNKPAHEKSMSTSPSQSSIGSAASLDQSVKLIIEDKNNEPSHTPKRCESDIEIISNPSQSSIEVLDDNSRTHGGSTPRRKRSSEERQVVAAPPQLVTVPELQPAFSTLTESSSSGSMTESVITAYEGHGTLNKRIISEECLPEEASEESTKIDEVDESKSTIIDSDKEIQSGEEENAKPEEEKVEKKTETDEDIYSYTDFSIIDYRIKLYLYQSVFEIENEEPTCLIKCQIWKTGGLDFQGCIVFTSKSLYILTQTSSSFGDKASEWLSKTEHHKINDLKCIFSLIWYQGIGLQLKNIHYLVLLQDKIRTENLLSFLSGLSLKGCKIKKKPNSKTELILQHLALSCDLHHTSQDPTVNLYSLCSKLSIYKGNVCHDTMRLVGIVVTSSELHIILGDLAWMTGSSSALAPSLHCSQTICSITEVEIMDKVLKIHFLEEAEGEEEVWYLDHVTNSELSLIVKTIQSPWESLFSVPLPVTSN